MSQYAPPVRPAVRAVPERGAVPVPAGHYRLLFDDLPPLEADGEALRRLGRAGGPCDLGASPDGAAESGVAAVWPLFGQFVAHEITADRSPLVHRADPAAIRNHRNPRLDLESMYGAGPVGSPYLYRRDDPAKLLLAPSGVDVPRNHEGTALIGDPRNDAHLFTSQMTVAFAGLHNRLVDRLRDDGAGDTGVFEHARRAAAWHLQHVILREFLPGLIGAETTAGLLAGGPALYRPGADPFIPLEFAGAAYRYGHAQIRDRYRVNARLGPCPLFPDLMGFGPIAPEHAVDWALLVDVDGRPPAQRAKRIDIRLPAALIALPTPVSGAAPGTDDASLAVRDLRRGRSVGLPSGEAIARRLGVPALDPEQVGLAERGWEGETPLWLYVLKEAEVLGAGERLGPVGGRIVGEVLVGIIDADPGSFRSVDPGWTPALLPARRAGAFGLADILAPLD